MKLIGCLLILILLSAWVAIEGSGYYLAAKGFGAWIGEGWNHPEWLTAIILSIVTSIIGMVLIRRHAAALPQELVGSFMGVPGASLGRRVVALIGAILLAIPGLVSDVFGILLLLPFVQILLASLAARIAMSLAKQTMGKMMSGKGGFPGMPGFPGAAGGGRQPFPGMMPGLGGFGMAPDDSATRRPKTYDVKPERDH